MAREIDLPLMKEYSKRLIEEHKSRRFAPHNSVVIPEYWSEVVFNGMLDLIAIDSSIKFGNIVENKNKLRIYTVPINDGIRNVLYDIYNEVDTLIADTIAAFIKEGQGAMFR
jgi:hypothetical protein